MKNLRVPKYLYIKLLILNKPDEQTPCLVILISLLVRAKKLMCEQQKKDRFI